MYRPDVGSYKDFSKRFSCDHDKQSVSARLIEYMLHLSVYLLKLTASGTLGHRFVNQCTAWITTNSSTRFRSAWTCWRTQSTQTSCCSCDSWYKCARVKTLVQWHISARKTQYGAEMWLKSVYSQRSWVSAWQNGWNCTCWMGCWVTHQQRQKTRITIYIWTWQHHWLFLLRVNHATLTNVSYSAYNINVVTLFTINFSSNVKKDSVLRLLRAGVGFIAQKDGSLDSRTGW